MENVDMTKYEDLAKGCASQLIKMFGGDVEAAIKMLEDHPDDAVGIAMDAHLEMMRFMTRRAVAMRGDFTKVIYSMVKTN